MRDDMVRIANNLKGYSVRCSFLFSVVLQVPLFSAGSGENKKKKYPLRTLRLAVKYLTAQVETI